MTPIILHRGFLSSQECSILNDWIKLGVENNWLDRGTDRKSDGLTYDKRLTTRPYGNRFEYPELVYSIFDRITKLLRVEHLRKSVDGGGRNGVVVSYTLPGGDVYPHIDPREGGAHLLRCNVMTQAADAGAELFIDGEKVAIGVGDLHCYLPSTVEHWVTKAEGDTPRIMWMFGYQISKADFLKLKEQHENVY